MAMSGGGLAAASFRVCVSSASSRSSRRSGASLDLKPAASASCSIHCVTQLHASTRGEVLSRTLGLTWDIRDFRAMMVNPRANP